MKRDLRLIYFLYALSIIIIVVISSLFYVQFKTLTNYSAEIDDTNQMIGLIENLKLELVNVENNQLDYLVRKDTSILEPELEVQSRINNLVEVIGQRIVNDKEQYANFVKMKDAVSNRLTALEDVWRKAEQNGTNINFERYFIKGREAMVDFRKRATKMEQYERRQLEQAFTQKQKYEQATPTYLYMVLGLTCIFQVLSFAFLLKEFRKRHSYQDQLEEKIKDLNITNSELEQMAFVASHDLQEPLRKIRTFSDRLLKKHSDSLDEEGQQMLQKINIASGRLQGLMADLVNYSSILQTDGENEPINLEDCMQDVMKNLADKIRAKGAIINLGPLPVVQGQYNQVYLLFFNLLDNSLKFTRQSIAPVVSISCIDKSAEETTAEVGQEVSHAYYRITVSDNGVGFMKEYAHKLFIIFQRLHTHNAMYPGKGIGLAICKRVVINHNGYITATGDQGAGATFNVYLPVPQMDR
ncbi:sensor histidine kinase [Aridibaculum aurantiacum]|uniref:sensor histidine kinase n=1 Tax=Aridibaculum aurantiacum TaxID=2810307 RepID=UPI001A976FF2|nr:sensor histidine kinase [Aridibaculum aurantiacum]